VELRGLRADFTTKKQGKSHFSSFSVYFVCRFPAPIEQQPHNLFSCPFPADVITGALFTPPSYPLLDTTPADPWLFWLHCCMPRQWFCISPGQPIPAAACFLPSAFDLSREFPVHPRWASGMVARPSAQWNGPS